MSDTEELNVGDFNPSTYEHVLPEGAHDFNDYDSDYEEQHPELGYTDKQVEAEVTKLDPDDKKLYEEYREFLDTYYHQHGKIIENAGFDQIDHDGPVPGDPINYQKRARGTAGETHDTGQEERDVLAGWARRGATQKDQMDSSRKNWKNHRCYSQ